jgi:hypothetical protein
MHALQVQFLPSVDTLRGLLGGNQSPGDPRGCAPLVTESGFISRPRKEGREPGRSLGDRENKVYWQVCEEVLHPG